MQTLVILSKAKNLNAKEAGRLYCPVRDDILVARPNEIIIAAIAAAIW